MFPATFPPPTFAAAPTRVKRFTDLFPRAWRNKFKSIGPVYECIPPRARKQVRESLDPCGRGGECRWRKRRWKHFPGDRRWCDEVARLIATVADRDRACYLQRP